MNRYLAYKARQPRYGGWVEDVMLAKSAEFIKQAEAQGKGDEMRAALKKAKKSKARKTSWWEPAMKQSFEEAGLDYGKSVQAGKRVKAGAPSPKETPVELNLPRLTLDPGIERSQAYLKYGKILVGSLLVGGVALIGFRYLRRS
jgi:hypothetical protein